MHSHRRLRKALWEHNPQRDSIKMGKFLKPEGLSFKTMQIVTTFP